MLITIDRIISSKYFRGNDKSGRHIKTKGYHLFEKISLVPEKYLIIQPFILSVKGCNGQLRIIGHEDV